MAEPTQLTPTEQDALVKQIGLAMLRVAPDDWDQLTIDYRAVGRYSEAVGKVVYTDGAAESWTMPPDLQGLFARLRGGMYREGRGTWFNARYRLDHPSSYNLEYDREEPNWDLPPPPAAYPDDMRMFPRSDDNVPGWLRRRLSAAPSAPPPPRFRVARIFDGPGAAVNRPPVSPDDVHDLLGYLDAAPLAGPARGYDVDRMDPEGRPSVPVAFHTDGTWIWPAAVNFYLREHDVPPESELVDHIARHRFEVPLVDDAARSAAAAFLGAGPGGPGPGGPGPGGPGGPGGPPPRGAGPTRAMPMPGGPGGPGPGRPGGPGGPGPGGPGGPPPPPPVTVVSSPPPAPVAPEPAGSAPQAALPSQGPPGRTIDALRTRLSALGVPESSFRIGPPTDRAWTMEQTEDGWRVGWYDRAFVAPAMFEDVADASAFLLGKLMMDAQRNRGVAGPVHVMPAQHPMMGDRLGTEDAAKNALGSDEPMRPSEQLDVPQPVAMTPPMPDYASPADGFGPGYTPDAGPGFGPGTPDGFGPGFGTGGPGPDMPGAPDLGQPDSGRHGRHGRHDEDQPGNGRSPYAQPDGVGQPNGHPDPVGAGRPDGLTRPVPPDSPFSQQREPLGAGPQGGSEVERTQFAPRDSLFTDSPPGGFERPDLGSPRAGFDRPGTASPRAGFDPPDMASPQAGFDRPDMAPPRPGLDRPDMASPHAGFDRPDLASPHAGLDRPDLASPHAGFDRPDMASPKAGFERPDMAPPRPGLDRPDMPPPGGFARAGARSPLDVQAASGLPKRGEPPTTVAQPPPARPAAATASGDWPISPLPGEPPLTLFRGKRLVELEPGTEIDRFGDDVGNLVYAVGTPFKERSLVPEWVDRPYRVYQVRQPVQVLTGAAIPWFDQPGGGTAYLLPDAIGELVALGRLVEVPGRERPQA